MTGPPVMILTSRLLDPTREKGKATTRFSGTWQAGPSVTPWRTKGRNEARWDSVSSWGHGGLAPGDKW